MFNKERLAKYDNDGYLVINDVLTDEEIQELVDVINTSEVIQNHLKKENNTFGFHLPEIAAKDKVFLKYASLYKIIELIKPILGEDIQIHHSKLTIKMPTKKVNNKEEDDKNIVPWHQDFAYFPHTNLSLLSVMICLVDFSHEMGCMQMIKGSHKYGILNHRNQDGTEAGKCIDPKLDDLLKKNPIIEDITPKKGGISIHHCLTLHKSVPNKNKNPRYSLVFAYRARDAYQLSGKIWKDTGFVVSGKSHNEPLSVRLENMEIPLMKGSGFHTLYGDVFNQYSSQEQSQVNLIDEKCDKENNLAFPMISNADAISKFRLFQPEKNQSQPIEQEQESKYKNQNLPS